MVYHRHQGPRVMVVYCKRAMWPLVVVVGVVVPMG
jgi:hypothetical protein